MHAGTGIMYTWEFVPGTDRLGWVRLDTWARGAWRDFPGATARAASLRRPDRRALRLGGRPDGPTFARVTFQ